MSNVKFISVVTTQTVLVTKLRKAHSKLKATTAQLLNVTSAAARCSLKSGRFGKYFGCTNTECKNTRKLLKNGEAAPPKMDPVPMPDLKCQKVDDTYVLRDGAAGLFLAASQFPRKRGTRTPQVAELIPYKSQIPEKYHYLLDAPAKDPEGNPTTIRYSRKTKEQYVASEKDGKATGWSAFYVNGKWVAKEKDSKK